VKFRFTCQKAFQRPNALLTCQQPVPESAPKAKNSHTKAKSDHTKAKSSQTKAKMVTRKQKTVI
jgi:hypothetical protein